MVEVAWSLRMASGSFDPEDHLVFPQVFSSGSRGGEERLMLAVLQDAVECFQQYAVSEQPFEKKLFQEAENWILASNTDWIFSFENICDTLQLNPGYIRSGLLFWRQAKRRNAHSDQDNCKPLN